MSNLANGFGGFVKGLFDLTAGGVKWAGERVSAISQPAGEIAKATFETGEQAVVGTVSTIGTKVTEVGLGIVKLGYSDAKNVGNDLQDFWKKLTAMAEANTVEIRNDWANLQKKLQDEAAANKAKAEAAKANAKTPEEKALAESNAAIASAFNDLTQVISDPSQLTAVVREIKARTVVAPANTTEKAAS